MFHSQKYATFQNYLKRYPWMVHCLLGVLCITKGTDGSLMYDGYDKEFPFAVSLQKMLSDIEHEHICIFSLITSKTALGAAHCLFKDEKLLWPDDLCGLVDKDLYRKYDDCRVISGHRYHELFNSTTEENDIAVLIFYLPVAFGPEVRPVKLAGPGFDVPLRQDVIVVGWGLGRFGKGLYSPFLLYTIMKTVELSICDEYTELDHTDMCLYKEGESTYLGDAGGPVVTKESNVQFGIIRIAEGDCISNPSVVLDIRHYHDWIKENSKGEPEFVN